MYGKKLSKNNQFIERTLTGLNIEGNDKRLCKLGFEFNESNTNEDCILVIGLNPAGGENVVKHESEERLNLNSLSQDNIKTTHVYNSYYRPIYKLMSEITGNNVKWPWCNKSWDELDTEFDKNKLSIYKEKLKLEFDKHKDRRFTLYIGDMFYYHETKSKMLPLIKETNYSEYCRDMLKLHIKVLRESKKSIKFIYVNNAQVSKWLCGDSIKTMDIIDSIKVFYGGMLSRGNMDAFSRGRLIDQIKSHFEDF
ncbi:hypothetical protein BN1356_02356 [Streptococcus varani]|uniref:Uncharacterized protein n=1 Tax=Streptococcus varani TaxID=1608583 RepID=A0A0E4H697_9STRE|nr:hypothetical protein [Streptococcus varani]CQR26011.1 hypothetical protein BN1356_02356 [Streptococcus varani]